MVLSYRCECDRVPRHGASPRHLGILLLAWHCARDDKLYILAGRMGLGTEPSQQQQYYRISTQSKAAEGPFIFLASPCDGWSQLRLSCTEHLKQWNIFLSQQMFWILGLCIKVYAVKGLYHCQFSVSEVWGQRQQKCSFWFPYSVFYCNRTNKNNINAWRIRKEKSSEDLHNSKGQKESLILAYTSQATQWIRSGFKKINKFRLLLNKYAAD